MRLSAWILALFTLCLAPFSHAFVVDGVCAPSPITIGVNYDSDFQLARNANIGWVRINMRWRDINPSYGVWNFTVPDSVVAAAEARGLKILAILSTAPAWAGGGSKGNTPPTNTSYWKEFVKRVSQRYAGRIAAYEIWNEPNLENNSGVGIGWDRNISIAPTYSDYVRIASTEIRTWALGTLVVAPGTSSRPNGRTVEIFRQIQNTGTSSYIDVISFHANGGTDSTNVVWNAVQSHLNTIASRNPSSLSKPIWITEMGWRSSSLGEGTQRDRILWLLDSMQGSGSALASDQLLCSGWVTRDFTHAFIFLLKDLPTESAGIYRLDSSPKPIVTDFLHSLAFPAIHTDSYQSVPFVSSCSGRACTFTSSFTDPGNLYDFHWGFGDGSPEGVAPYQVTHTFPRRGWFRVEMALLLKGSSLGGGGDARWIYVP